MNMIDVLVLPVPSLLCMLVLWFCVRGLDRLPADDFSNRRFLMKMALFNLIMVIGFMGFTIYSVPRLLAAL